MSGVSPIGQKAIELARRGDFDGAAASFQRAVELGHDPQPDQARLALATGRADDGGSTAVRLYDSCPWASSQCDGSPRCCFEVLHEGGVDLPCRASSAGQG